jgi:putative zinc finger/helix-turn-helix YgiT family protein
MKSPITGKEMRLTKEKRSMEFRKESLEIVFHYFQCADSREQFTTTDLDEINTNQVYNQYRDKLNIPFPDEITRIREQYGLSAARMSEILGFGVNSYRQYEAGEMPSAANAKLIQMAADPKKFIDMVELCSSLDEKTKAKHIQKANQLVEEKQRNLFRTSFQDYLFGSHLADIYSGYRNPDLAKFTEMVVFFAEQLSPYKTKMNKLLFYADFMMFRKSCFSISGVRYRAIDMGPVPNNYQSIFEYIANSQEIDIHTTEFPDGYTGEQFKTRQDRRFNPAMFSEQELTTLHKVVDLFKDTSTRQIIHLSHLESAWKRNEATKTLISYAYAFELEQF